MIDFVKPQGSKKNSQAAEDAVDKRASGNGQSNLFHHHHDEESGLDYTRSESLNKSAWEDELEEAKHQPWNSTLQGRAAIRLFSRGVMGATFFALGSRITRDSLKGYNQLEKPSAFNLPQNIAYTIDRFVGRPLEKVANAIGRDGKELVTFRPTRVHKTTQGLQQGFTLGHETVGITFDFATMSIGDAMGRDIANAFDPNVKQNWVDNEGHIKYNEVAKNIGYNSWKYLTYNQGEDWAVALPYVFFTRWQRNAIDKMSPGFGYDNDRRINGGSFKVDDQGKVIGTYGLEGAMDLQTRFTVYNIGTLMYREAYTSAANKLHNWYESGMKLPNAPATIGSAASSVMGSVGNTIRWAARDAVKGALYMTPAAPAFWLFRTPQTKYRAAFINPEKGAIAYRNGPGAHDWQFLHAHEYKRSENRFAAQEGKQAFDGYNPTSFRNYEGHQWVQGQSVPNPISPHMTARDLDGDLLLKYPSFDHTYGTFDAMVNPIGKINNAIRKHGHYPIGKIKGHMNIDLDNQQIRAKHFTDDVINASFAYTPYFFMKSDVMAVNWDTAKMDMAIERTLDGAASFKPTELTQGVGEIWKAMWHKPFNDPEREIEAQRRICNDKSPPDGQHFFENARCFDEALQDISLHSAYHRHADTKQFVERLQDSKKRSRNMLDNFRNDVAGRFTDYVGGVRPVQVAAPENKSFADRERVRQAQNRDDFPDIGTTVH